MNTRIHWGDSDGHRTCNHAQHLRHSEVSAAEFLKLPNLCRTCERAAQRGASTEQKRGVTFRQVSGELSHYYVYDSAGEPICLVLPVGVTPDKGPLQGIFLPDMEATARRAEWIAESLRKNPEVRK